MKRRVNTSKLRNDNDYGIMSNESLIENICALHELLTWTASSGLCCLMRVPLTDAPGSVQPPSGGGSFERAEKMPSPNGERL